MSATEQTKYTWEVTYTATPDEITRQLIALGLGRDWSHREPEQNDSGEWSSPKWESDLFVVSLEEEGHGHVWAFGGLDDVPFSLGYGNTIKEAADAWEVMARKQWEDLNERLGQIEATR